MPGSIDAKSLKALLRQPDEIALFDVRELGAYSQGHPFHTVPLPYSRLELDLERLAPRKTVRMVMFDGGEGTAAIAARRAGSLGYTNVSVLTGGVQAWAAAGYTLFEGVNVPSKTFGELIEIERHTPRITCADLVGMQDRGENMVIVDGRTWAEYQNFNIPGGISCPNGELALHIDGIAPDPKTKIVVNCAGRTRSIIGAQTLIDLGVPNDVVALENGTQGWWLLGLNVEKGADRRAPSGDLSPVALERKRSQARRHAEHHGVTTIDADGAIAASRDPGRSTYLLDVRTAEEFNRGALPGFAHAPGGQLQQATDQWVGVKGGRIILSDSGEGIRALMVAAWLRQLGHEASVVSETPATRAAFEASGIVAAGKPGFDAARIRLREVGAGDVAALLGAKGVTVLDLRPSMDFRRGHIPGSQWSIRPRVGAVVKDTSKPVVLVSDDAAIAGLAALDLAEAGAGDVALLKGGLKAWEAAGEKRAVTPNDPPDAACIDFIFHTLGRNEGNLDAARAYLAWEVNLVSQLDADERAAFRLR